MEKSRKRKIGNNEHDNEIRKRKLMDNEFKENKRLAIIKIEYK